jgi:8-oxo-dGTP diphosphatase
LVGTLQLALDHVRIIGDAVERAKSKLEYSPLGAAFCGDEFTIVQFRTVYGAVWGTRLDPRNFHRKATGTPDFLEDTGRMTMCDSGRPTALSGWPRQPARLRDSQRGPCSIRRSWGRAIDAAR